MQITPAFALAVDFSGQVVFLGEGRLLNPNGKLSDDAGVLGVVKKIHRDPFYAEPDPEYIIPFTEQTRSPLAEQLGLSGIPTYIKPATSYFSPLHYGFTCLTTNEDRVVMNRARKASVIIVERL